MWSPDQMLNHAEIQVRESINADRLKRGSDVSLPYFGESMGVLNEKYSWGGIINSILIKYPNMIIAKP